MICKEFDFSQFLTETIVRELKIDGANQNVARRRIAILLAQWCQVDISEHDKPLVYEMYQHLLDPIVKHNDLAVRITAGKRLVNAIIEWRFKSAAFALYAPTILDHLLNLIREVTLAETKLALLDTVNAVVERMELEVRPMR